MEKIKKIGFISYMKLSMIIFFMGGLLNVIYIDIFLKTGEIILKSGVMDFTLSKPEKKMGIFYSIFQGNMFGHVLLFILYGAVFFGLFSFVLLNILFKKKKFILTENSKFYKENDSWIMKKIDRRVFIIFFAIPFIFYQSIGFLIRNFLFDGSFEINGFNECLSNYLLSTFYFIFFAIIGVLLVNPFLNNSEGLKLKLQSFDEITDENDFDNSFSEKEFFKGEKI